MEILLIDCKVSFNLTCSEDCLISSGTRQTNFTVNDTKLFVPVVTLWTQINLQLLRQLELSFNRKITAINIDQRCQYKIKTNISII